ncbi:MAG: SDR family oxidoreductase [Ruminococcaceae bacterium]|nr:SDR family oxidoreductase [Oscillospiraceae bacterium]
MNSLISLVGKVAVISGGAAGIGLGTAEVLAEHGAIVALLDVSKKGEEAAEALRSKGYQAVFYLCDVTDAKSCRETISAIADKFGRIDILFNNAGVTVRKTIVDLTEEEWDFVIDVGLKGTYLLSKYAIPIMAAGGGGSIINTGSGWGLKGGDRAAAYCAVKGGIVNLSRAMAIDHGAQNIRVNSVCPGDTETAMLREEQRQLGENDEIFMRNAIGSRPLQRIGTPRDIAHTVLYLASDLSTWVTGTAIPVDGGGIA